MRPGQSRLLTEFMGWDGVKAPATVSPGSTRKECCRSVAALLPFLLPVISLTINIVTDVAGFPSITLMTVLSTGPSQAYRAMRLVVALRQIPGKDFPTRFLSPENVEEPRFFNRVCA